MFLLHRLKFQNILAIQTEVYFCILWIVVGMNYYPLDCCSDLHIWVQYRFCCKTHIPKNAIALTIIFCLVSILQALHLELVGWHGTSAWCCRCHSNITDVKDNIVWYQTKLETFDLLEKVSFIFFFINFNLWWMCHILIRFIIVICLLVFN
jgi:hypothetical protein